MPESIVLILARSEGRCVGGALNLIGPDAIYGRYWGATEHHQGLHFECCYHQAIDLAIERGLQRVEAGAQGQHKLQRGYTPALTHSSHHVAHSGFREAIADFLQRESRSIREHVVELTAQSPFRDDRANARSDA